MKWSKTDFSIGVLLIFYTVGTVGIAFELSQDMVSLSWLNLWLTGIIIFANRTEKHLRFYLFSIAVFIVGLLIEILGVATGFPFGYYHYGGALGWKIYEVPLVLGLNWWILAYSSIHLAIFISNNKIVRMCLAPALMLGMDLLIEPLCSKLDFWYWKDTKVPLENYLSWYVISFVLIGIYFLSFKTKKINYVAIVAFMVQLLFFSLLNVLL